MLIVDDFMKAGGTMNGMVSLLEEFNATWRVLAVFVESERIEQRLIEDYVSLLKIIRGRRTRKKNQCEPWKLFYGKRPRGKLK